MLRGMVFVDHMNFDIAVQDYYRDMGKPFPKLDYNNLFSNIVALRENVSFLKAMIFAPQPDEFLLKGARFLSYWKWVSGLKNQKYLDVVFGRHIARPISDDIEMDIEDRKTYYTLEKGTDINLAIHALTKAHFDSYDIAFVASCDTDYITVYQQLKNIGKIVILVAVKGQYFGKVIPEVDDFIVLDENFFNACLRQEKLKSNI